MRKKNYIFILLFCVIIAFSFCVISCNCNNNEKENPIEQEDEIALFFVNASYEVNRFSSTKLEINYNGTEKVVFSSADESIAVVKDGAVFALNIGTAQITASAGDLTASCSIHVKQGTGFASLKLSQREVSILCGKSKTVNAQVLVDGDKPLDTSYAVVEYSSDNTDIATVNNSGVIESVEIGSCNIVVKAKISDVILMETISVEVKESATLSFDKSSATIYTNSVGGEKSTQENLQVYVYENDIRIENPVLSWSTNNEGVVDVDNGIITGLNKGLAEVYVKYVTTKQTELSATFIVNVEYPVIELDNGDEIEICNVEDYILDLSAFESFLDGGISQVVITDDEKEINVVNDNGIITFDKKTLDYGHREMSIVLNSQIEITYHALVITKIISTPEELGSFAVTYGGRESTTQNHYEASYTGYYVLANDIDMTGVTMDSWHGEEAVFQTMNPDFGFKGVFDGRGHTIYNVGGAIFGRISRQGTVKNFAVYNDDDLVIGGAVISALIAGNVENVFVSVSMEKYVANQSAVCYRTLGSPVFSNMVVEVRKYTPGITLDGEDSFDIPEDAMPANVLLIMATDGFTAFNNVFLLSQSKADFDFRFGGCFGTYYRYELDKPGQYEGLDLSSGYWTLKDGRYVFKTLAAMLNCTKLDTVDYSSIKVEEGILSWSAVDNAEKYSIWLSGKEYESITNSFVLPIDKTYRIKVKAIGDKISFLDGSYSNAYVYITIQQPYLMKFDDDIYCNCFHASKTNGGNDIYYPMYGSEIFKARELTVNYDEDCAGSTNGAMVLSFMGSNNGAYFGLDLLNTYTSEEFKGDLFIRYKSDISIAGVSIKLAEEGASDPWAIMTETIDGDGWKTVRITKSNLQEWNGYRLGFYFLYTSAVYQDAPLEVSFDYIVFDYEAPLCGDSDFDVSVDAKDFI